MNQATIGSKVRQLRYNGPRARISENIAETDAKEQVELPREFVYGLQCRSLKLSFRTSSNRM